MLWLVSLSSTWPTSPQVQRASWSLLMRTLLSVSLRILMPKAQLSKKAVPMSPSQVCSRLSWLTITASWRPVRTWMPRTTSASTLMLLRPRWTRFSTSPSSHSSTRSFMWSQWRSMVRASTPSRTVRFWRYGRTRSSRWTLPAASLSVLRLSMQVLLPLIFQIWLLLHTMASIPYVWRLLVFLPKVTCSSPTTCRRTMCRSHSLKSRKVPWLSLRLLLRWSVQWQHKWTGVLL